MEYLGHKCYRPPSVPKHSSKSAGWVLPPGLPATHSDQDDTSSPHFKFLPAINNGDNNVLGSLHIMKACKVTFLEDQSTHRCPKDMGLVKQRRQKGADGGTTTSLMLTEMQLSERSSFSEGPSTLFCWHITASLLSSSPPWAVTPLYLISPCMAVQGVLGMAAAEQPQPLAGSSIPVVLL